MALFFLVVQYLENEGDNLKHVLGFWIFFFFFFFCISIVEVYDLFKR